MMYTYTVSLHEQEVMMVKADALNVASWLVTKTPLKL